MFCHGTGSLEVPLNCRGFFFFFKDKHPIAFLGTDKRKQRMGFNRRVLQRNKSGVYDIKKKALHCNVYFAES